MGQIASQPVANVLLCQVASHSDCDLPMLFGRGLLGEEEISELKRRNLEQRNNNYSERVGGLRER